MADNEEHDQKTETETDLTATDLLEPSEALNRLDAESLDDAIGQGETFEQVRYGFPLGAIGLLTPLGMVCEILEEVQQIYVLPNTAAWFEGLINLRGNLVPVFDIGRLLEVSENNAAKDNTKGDKNMLVIGSGDRTLALIIDGLPQPVTAERQETDLPPIADYAKSFVNQAYSFQQRIWIDLDLETYLMSLRSRLAAA